MRRVGETLMVCSWRWISDSLDFGRDDGGGAFSMRRGVATLLFCERVFFVFLRVGTCAQGAFGISEEMGRLMFIACRLFLLSDGDRP